MLTLGTLSLQNLQLVLFKERVQPHKRECVCTLKTLNEIKWRKKETLNPDVIFEIANRAVQIIRPHWGGRH